tara:strand:- start:205 stop:1074 length:870 start_codon:yes stop_codon:yes gene_type:complete
MGHTEIAQALVAAGADVNARDKNGDTALLLASMNGHTETAQALVAAGADKNARNKHGDTGLILASGKGHTETARALIDAGANVNAVDKGGNTALILASRSGHLKAVQALVAAGADVNAATKSRNTALILASVMGHWDVVEQLSKSPPYVVRHARFKIPWQQGRQAPASQGALVEMLQRISPNPSSARWMGGTAWVPPPDTRAFKICVVCQEKRPDVYFVPCGHQCMCYGCFLHLPMPLLCPYCRRPIKDVRPAIEANGYNKVYGTAVGTEVVEKTRVYTLHKQLSTLKF